MARFRYSLQSILDIKMKLETQAKQMFAAATGVLNEEESRLNALVQRKLQYEVRGRELLAGNLQIKEIEENKNAISYIDGCIVEQARKVEQAKLQVERAREAMAEAMMERKTYESLREQALEDYLAEEGKAENKAVDELVSYTYGQKRQVKDNG